MKYRKFYFALLCSLSVLMSCSSCHNDPKEEPEAPKPTHTLLIYMMGDNNLSYYCSKNIRLLNMGLLNAAEDINIVIYKDNRDSGDGLPSLFQLKRSIDKTTREAKIDTVMIKEWSTELNSCDMTVFSDVVKTTFSMFDTEVKGVEMWSHALSWVPAGNNTKSTRYIGQDDNSFFELWDIRQALETCPHLDYMMFDCCFCGMAEVAHEFDGVADYIYGPITEIMGSGLPYDLMVPVLADCRAKKDVRQMLQNCVKTMGVTDLYDGNGYTITAIETAKIKEMATAVAELRNAVPEKLETLKKNGKSLEANFQHYGRSRVNTRYHFYDLYDYVDFLAEGGSDDVKKLKEKIDKNAAIVAYACTKEFSEGFESIDLSKCKGLGLSVPEFFNLTYEEQKLTKNYGKCKWGMALGF